MLDRYIVLKLKTDDNCRLEYELVDNAPLIEDSDEDYILKTPLKVYQKLTRVNRRNRKKRNDITCYVYVYNGEDYIDISQGNLEKNKLLLIGKYIFIFNHTALLVDFNHNKVTYEMTNDIPKFVKDIDIS